MHAQMAEQSTTFDQLMARACSIAWDQGFAKDATDLFVVTAGLPFGVKGAANVIRILPAAGPEAWLLPSTNIAQQDLFA
jgi:pyruvate kinase